jgi:hypothetical protein
MDNLTAVAPPDCGINGDPGTATVISPMGNCHRP